MLGPSFVFRFRATCLGFVLSPRVGHNFNNPQSRSKITWIVLVQTCIMCILRLLCHVLRKMLKDLAC